MRSIISTNEPLWRPSRERIGNSAMTRFHEEVNQRYQLAIEDYRTLHRWSTTSVSEFWAIAWDFCGIVSSQKNDEVVRDYDRFPGAKWFPDARLNFAENMLWRRDDHLALISLLENGQRKTFTYAELYEEVEKLASALRSQGVGVGDRVAALMPNIGETVVAMLATTSIGAIWSSCSPDFGINGALDRLGQIKPKVLFVVDGYFYNGKVIDCSEKNKAVAAAIDSLKCVIEVSMLSRGSQGSCNSHDAYNTSDPESFQKDKGLFQRYHSFLVEQTIEPLKFEQLPFDHPIYIMYSSGTTGKPKCIVHGAGGTLLQHKKELMLHTDIGRDDVLFFFTTCGWMMWNWMISGLAVGCTVVLYDGSPFAREGTALIDAIEEENITVFGCGAKYIASLEKTGIRPGVSHDLSSLKSILSTGSPLGTCGFEYVYRDFKSDVCLSSISGGTDIISCFVLGNPNLPVYSGEIQCRGLGMAVEFWGDSGEPLEGEKGELVCTKPFPSTPVGFWDDPEDRKFLGSYFETYQNVWAHGDYGELTQHDGIVIYGRSDAILNPGGVRIGTAEIYRQVEAFIEVADSVAVGQRWKDDERIILFVVMNNKFEFSEELEQALKASIRKCASPRHVPDKIIPVADIPRTISGKIVEIAVKNVINGQAVTNRGSLANPEALENFENLQQLAE